MPIENAQDFLAKLYERDESVLELLPKDFVADKIGNKEIETAANAAIAAGWDFAADELREAYLDSLSLDENELSAVAGGGAQGNGGCSSSFYAEQCYATVEEGSDCQCTDYNGDSSGPCIGIGYHKC